MLTKDVALTKKGVGTHQKIAISKQLSTLFKAKREKGLGTLLLGTRGVYSCVQIADTKFRCSSGRTFLSNKLLNIKLILLNFLYQNRSRPLHT